MTDDEIISFIENFEFDAGPVAVERRNRGFTLIHAETGVPIACLRPVGRDDLVDIRYCSLWKERWVPFGPFGRTAACVEQPVRVISEAAIFWSGPSYSTPFQTRMNFNLLTESFGDRSCCRKAII